MQVGAFELTEPLAAGGMGQVWLATHRGRSIDAAVKFITNTDDDSRRQALLENEVHAAARLNHPGVVALYDFATLKAPIHHGEHHLRAGTPYLVMELAKGGSLSHWLRRVTQPTWVEARRILEQVLAALAHAHAHGVLHRDVKPGNILLRYPGATLGRVMLTDFGIAHVAAGTGNPLSSLERAGTPSYMAPEQLLGKWRQFGPATDLYAVGGLAWRLVAGRPPFWDLPADKRMRARMTASPARFEPRVAIPRDLEEWIRWLLEKPVRARPQFAAEALEALWGLGTAMVDGHTIKHPSEPDDITLMSTNSAASTATGGSSPMAAGVGLCSLRWIPIEGREPDVQVVQASFEAVRRTEQCHVIEVTGPDGIGKSHLIRATAADIHAEGQATLLEADAASAEVAKNGLLTLLKLHGADSDTAAEVITARYPDLATSDALWLIRWLCLDEEFPVTTRQYLWMEVLRREASQRPMIVWINHADQQHRAVCDWMLLALDGTLSSVPILFVLTATQSHPDHELYTHDRVRAHALSPLPRGVISRILRQLTGFTHGLADRLSGLSNGNAGVAVNLAQSLVDRGAVKTTAQGVDIDRDTKLEARGLVQSWRPRVMQALAELDAATWPAAFTVAALDRYFTDALWRRVVSEAGFDHNDDVIPALARHGLLRSTGDSWQFESPAAAAGLSGFARGLGQWRMINRHLVKVVDPDMQPGLRRIVCEAAGDLRRAIRACLDEAESSLLASDLHNAHAALNHAEGLLIRKKLERTHDYWKRLWLLRLEVTRYRALWDEHERCVKALANDTDPQTQCRIALHQGLQAFSRGDIASAELAMHRAAGDGANPKTIGLALLHLAYLAEQRGDLDGAMSILDECLAAYEDTDSTRGVAGAYASRSHCLNTLGRHEEALAALDESDRIAQDAGSLLNLASNLSDRSNIYAEMGRLDEAIALLKKAHTQLRGLGLSNLYVVALNLGVRHLERGDPAAAVDVLEGLVKEQVAIPSARHNAIRQLFLAEAYGTLRHWSSAEDSFFAAYKVLRDQPYIDKTLADSLGRLAVLAVEQHTELAPTIRSFRQAVLEALA